MEQIGVIGYGIAALAFTALGVLLAIAWEGRARGFSLILAATLTALWTTCLAVFSGSESAATELLFIGETLTTGAWIAVLASFVGTAGFPRRFAGFALLAWSVVLVAGIAVSGPARPGPAAS